MAIRTSSAAVIDGSAISLSSLCLIHCLLLPIASAALPAVGAWAELEWVHQMFVAAALPFSLIALRSKKTTGLIGTLIVSGFLLLVAGAFVEPLHDYETVLTVLGGVLLASGHGLRWVRPAHADQE